MNIIEKAKQYATEKHAQTGKLYNEKPYIIHPKLTSLILMLVAPEDTNLIAAGYLHDVIEDCDVSYEEIRHLFGADIADLVQEVTKDKNKDFPALTTERGLMLKVADRLANVSSAKDNTDTKKRKKLFKKYSYCFINEGTHAKHMLK